MNKVREMIDEAVLIGVDVGTGSVRAGIFNIGGRLLAYASKEITLFRGPQGHFEQSSNEIWKAACCCIREAIVTSRVPLERVAGIGFDATCSLVVVGHNGKPLPVGVSEDAERNIIVWMDHRATKQAALINATGHPVLKYVGGKISPEMETPKLLWLKQHRPDVYDAAWQFFDLADYLTWRATGDLTRSICTVTCKWTYLAHEQRWDPDYFRTIGLADLVDENFQRIGINIVEPGKPCGRGLSAESAREMGLLAGTPVAVGIIDAHAGGIGTLGTCAEATRSLAYVFGTSSCTMSTSVKPVLIPGVWGPYYSAMIPGCWLNEGGQSAAGAAIKQLLHYHPAASEAESEAKSMRLSLPDYLANLVIEKVPEASKAVELAYNLHVVPEFMGNRAPFADPHARAVIMGLGMENDRESLLALYVAGLCGIGYGLRQIIEAQSLAGLEIDQIVVSGGAARHSLVLQLLADSCGCNILTTGVKEPVLLGTAMLAAVSGGIISSVQKAMKQLSEPDKLYRPDTQLAGLHDRRYEAYKSLQNTAKLIRQGQQ